MSIEVTRAGFEASFKEEMMVVALSCVGSLEPQTAITLLGIGLAVLLDLKEFLKN